MKNISKELANKISKSHIGSATKSVKWNDIYDSEQELLSDMMLVDTTSNVIVKGYMYIESFQKQYAKNGALTEKQMVQLKRLACEIAYAIHIKDYKW